MSDTSPRSTQTTSMADAPSVASAFATHTASVGWGAPIISILVLTALGIMVVLSYTVPVPEGAQSIIIGLAETLKVLSVAVVSYWMGSSVGSARKDAIIHDNIMDARASTSHNLVEKILGQSN